MISLAFFRARPVDGSSGYSTISHGRWRLRWRRLTKHYLLGNVCIYLTVISIYVFLLVFLCFSKHTHLKMTIMTIDLHIDVFHCYGSYNLIFYCNQISHVFLNKNLFHFSWHNEICIFLGNKIRQCWHTYFILNNLKDLTLNNYKTILLMFNFIASLLSKLL